VRQASTKRAAKLFLGVGNVLWRDDGVGVRAAQIMAERRLPPDVEVYDAGTIGLDAAVALERRRLVVVADAIDARAEPGTVFRFHPEELRPYSRSAFSLHDVHLLDALDETRLLGTAPEEVVILAVQVGDVSSGLGLSPPVEASMEKLLNLAAQALGLPPLRAEAATERPPPGRPLEPERSSRWH
jgi:hydrogenase maturation protease